MKNSIPPTNESTWPPKAKLSKGDYFITGDLGEITDDGLRGYICTACGKTITEAHHVKPECYRVHYKGEVFYLERHVCKDCMKNSK